MNAGHRTHHQRQKRTGARAIITRRTIKITAKTRTSVTRGEYKEEVEEEDEEAVITCLWQELESRQNKTRVAIESSKKEAEQLWLKKVASADRIKGLDQDTEDL